MECGDACRKVQDCFLTCERPTYRRRIEEIEIDCRHAVTLELGPRRPRVDDARHLVTSFAKKRNNTPAEDSSSTCKKNLHDVLSRSAHSK